MRELPPHTRMIGCFDVVSKYIRQRGVINLDDGFALLKDAKIMNPEIKEGEPVKG